jgi:glutaredoxin-related protein
VNDAQVDAKSRIADIVKTNDVVLFMKGTALFPQCGFSSRSISLAAIGIRGWCFR